MDLIRHKKRMLSVLLAFLLSAQVTALGGNGNFIAISFSIFYLIWAMACSVSLCPPASFWKSSVPILVCASIAICWVALPRCGYDNSLCWGSYAESDGYPFGYIVPLIVMMILFVASAALGTGYGIINHAVGYIVVAGAINLAIGLSLRESNPNDIWGIPRPVGGDRFSGTMLNANAAACLYGMHALLALGLFQDTERRKRTKRPINGIVAGAIAFANAGACIVTGSRTALSLLIVGALVLIVRPLSGRHARRGWVMAGIFSIVTIATLSLAGEITTQRFLSLGGDAESRWTIWSHYWSIAGQAPLFGFGLGSFSDVNLHFLADEHEAAMFWYINDAHNLILRLLIEGGWPYLILLFVMAGWIFHDIHSERQGVFDRPSYRAIPAALAFALGCGMTDIALSVPAIVALCAVLSGLLWGRAVRIKSDRYASAGKAVRPPQ